MLPRALWRQSTHQPPALNAVGGRVFRRKTRACARASCSGARGNSGPLLGGVLARALRGSGRHVEVSEPPGEVRASGRWC